MASGDEVGDDVRTDMAGADARGVNAKADAPRDIQENGWPELRVRSALGHRKGRTGFDLLRSDDREFRVD